MDEEEIEIKFSVSKELLQKIPNSFKSDDFNILGKLAFLEFVHWLMADQRYSTIPDLEAHRVMSIYNEILITKLPSSEELSSALDMVPSRGEYIAHTIRYQNSRWWKKRLVETAIQNCKDAVSQEDIDTHKVTTYKVTTDLACQMIFDQIFLNLAETERIPPPKGKRVLGFLQYMIGVDLLPKVRTALEAERIKLTSEENGG